MWNISILKKMHLVNQNLPVIDFYRRSWFGEMGIYEMVKEISIKGI